MFELIGILGLIIGLMALWLSVNTMRKVENQNSYLINAYLKALQKALKDNNAVYTRRFQALDKKIEDIDRVQNEYQERIFALRNDVERNLSGSKDVAKAPTKNFNS